MTTIEHRTFAARWRTDTRAPGGKGRRRWATAVTYNTVDRYGTTWRPGVFDAGLAEQLPIVLYGHEYSHLENVLGRGVDFRQTPSSVGLPGVDVLIEFADPAKVPAAGLAMALIDDKVLTDVSVGFDRREWLTREKMTDAERKAGASEAMVRAGMDELSIVAKGAVLGASLRGARRPQADRRPMAQVERELDELLDDLRSRGIISRPAPAFRSPAPLSQIERELDGALRRIGRRS